MAQRGDAPAKKKKKAKRARELIPIRMQQNLYKYMKTLIWNVGELMLSMPCDIKWLLVVVHHFAPASLYGPLGRKEPDG